MYLMHRPQVTQPSDPSYRIIALTRGQVTLVDAEEYERLSLSNWQAHWNKTSQSWYAKKGVSNGRGGTTTVQMAREILGVTSDVVVDHENHDTLDNRKSNLRIATVFQNQHNRAMTKRNSTGYKGVSRAKGTKDGPPLWRASIMINRKAISLGCCFTSPELAFDAYKEAANKYHVDFAHY